MADVQIHSNIEEATRQASAAFRRFPRVLESAQSKNVTLVMKGSIVEIDRLIYETPPTPYYVRTKNLRRSNKRERLGRFAWLVYNDADYAGYVHDGTSKMSARPWMQNAIDLLEPVLEDNLVRAGVEAFEESAASPF